MFCSVNTIKKELTWLKEVDKFSLQNSLKDLDKAFKNFFEGNAKYPKFKSKKNKHQSYRTNFTNNNIKIEGNRIKLPKLGWVKFVKSREVEGKILNVSTFTIALPYHNALYSSIFTNFAHALSDMNFDNLSFFNIFLTFKSSKIITWFSFIILEDNLCKKSSL